MNLDQELSTRVTVVIPSWNTRQWLAGCLDGLRTQNFQNFVVLLVDNGSTDGSVDFVRGHYPEIEVIRFSANRGFAFAANAGIAAAKTDYVALLNPDTIPCPNWLAALVATLDAAPAMIGGLASKMLQLSNPTRIDDAGNTLSWYGSARKRGIGAPATAHNEPTDVFSVCAGAALYRRTFLKAVGGFDERFGSYLEDIDLCLRGHLIGYRYRYVPEAEVLHKGHGAGIRYGRYVASVTRNRLALLLKSIPLPLLLKHLDSLLFGQFYYLLAYKRPWHTLTGTVSFLAMLPHILQRRRDILSRRSISNSVLDELLTKRLGEIPLRFLLRDKLRRLLDRRD
jgi:GT2 family glycosyltransferase